jgi:hypothetical protein
MAHISGTQPPLLVGLERGHFCPARRSRYRPFLIFFRFEIKDRLGRRSASRRDNDMKLRSRGQPQTAGVLVPRALGNSLGE